MTNRNIDSKHVFLPFFISFFILATSACQTTSVVNSTSNSNRPEVLDRPYILLISIDGYRADYTDLYSPPHIKKFREKAASAQLLPVYPSKTFTNHYSIATGLYSENHGIVANTFYDPVRHEQYRLSNPETVRDGTWYSGEPLWVAAEKQGMLAANFFWPGSEAQISGGRASYYYFYNDTIPLEFRVEQVKKWLQLPPDKRPHFITLYFSDVDTAGHHFGPESEQVQKAIQKVDVAIGDLLAKLEPLNLPLNIFIVSDHGMQKVDPTKVEFLDDYADLSQVRIEGDGPQVNLYHDNPIRIDQVFRQLKKNAKHFKVFKKEQMPLHYHYSKNPRVGNLVVVADAPYSIGTHRPNFHVDHGNHGYDPDNTPSMRGIFYASGSNIKGGIKTEPFRNIHIYPLIMKILGLKILQPIDGDEKVLKNLYVPHPFAPITRKSQLERD